MTASIATGWAAAFLTGAPGVSILEFMRKLAVVLVLTAGCGAQGPAGPAVQSSPARTAVTLTIKGLPSSLAAGMSVQLAAMAQFSDGSSKDVTSAVTWQSSNVLVASCSTTGLLTALATGQADVSAGYASLTATTRVSVAGLAAIAIRGAADALLVGDSTQLVATGTFSDGSQADLTAHVTWQSSDATVAMVTTSGLVTAVAQGHSDVRAAYLGITGVQSTTVAAVRSIAISGAPADGVVLTGSSTQLSATATLSDGSSRDVTTRVAWSSTNPSAAVVSSPGTVSAVRSGAADITATFSGASGRGHVIVVNSGPTISHLFWQIGTCGPSSCSPEPLDEIVGACTVTDPDARVLTITVTVTPEGGATQTASQVFPIAALPRNLGASLTLDAHRQFGSPPRATTQCSAVDDLGRTVTGAISAPASVEVLLHAFFNE